MYLTKQQITDFVSKIGQPRASVMLNAFFNSYRYYLDSCDVTPLYDKEYREKVNYHLAMEMVENRYKVNIYNGYTFNYIRQKITKSTSILDFGCGSGEFALALATLGPKKVLGVDFSSIVIKQAKKMLAESGGLPCEFICANIAELEDSNRFDFITLNDVTEHLSDRELNVLFEVLYKLLAPNGEIVIHTPNGLAICNDVDSDIFQRTYKLYLRIVKGWRGHERTIDQIYYDQVHINIKSYKELAAFLGQYRLRSKVLYDERSKYPFLDHLSANMLIVAYKREVWERLREIEQKSKSYNLNKARGEISRPVIIRALRSHHRIKAKNPIIRCDKVSALAYYDILELYLLFSGVRDWQWVDSEEHKAVQQPLARIIGHLFRDVLAWPLIIRRVKHALKELENVANFQPNLANDKTMLFIRSDHWFNIKSGGSVGHLKGVIDGLHKLGYTRHIISTDHLVGVKEDACFHLCVPQYELGRNLPEVPALLYNDQLINFVDEGWMQWSPAFIYQRYSLGNFSGVALKAKWRVPFVCEYNGSFPWMARKWGGKKLFHENLLTDIELLNLKAADVIVVVSVPMKVELTELGIEPDKILVNPNGVNPDIYSPDVDGSRIREKYGLGGKTVIGFIGTFGPWHGAEVLAEAFGLLLARYPHYHSKVQMLMIGDGPRMTQVLTNIAKYQIEDACILTGQVPQDEGPAYLAACDILASPHVPNPDGTPFFGSPTKLFEYMAMGKGIVASDLDQIGEILEHDRTAWMVKPGDVRSLMLGLKKLIDDQDRCIRLGQAARDEVVVKYTWREHTRKIVEKLKKWSENN